MHHVIFLNAASIRLRLVPIGTGTSVRHNYGITQMILFNEMHFVGDLAAMPAQSLYNKLRSKRVSLITVAVFTIKTYYSWHSKIHLTFLTQLEVNTQVNTGVFAC